MKLKIRKIKSYLRWAKKQYLKKYGIKVEKMIFTKEQLKIIQKALNRSFDNGNCIKVGRIKKRVNK